jgi:hypothetical protein
MKSKADLEAQVFEVFTELFGDDHIVQIHGDPLRREGVSSHEYVSHIIVDGHVIARAIAKDWRQSYRLLKFQVEKLYIDGHALV